MGNAKTTKTDTETTRLCGCECGTPTKGTFAPGHDARMVSKALEASRSSQPYLGASGTISEYAKAIERVGSGALVQKFVDAVEREARRIEAKQERQKARAADKHARKAAKVPQWQNAGEVRVGRWTYPSRTDGKVTQRNTKRDGSGEWVTL